MTMKDRDGFKNYLESRGLSSDNIYNLTRIYQSLPFPDVKELENYLAELNRNKTSGSYYNKHIQVIRHYGKWQGWAPDVIAKFSQIRDRSKEVPAFSDSQIEQFLALGDQSKPISIFFYIVAYQGTRMSEVRTLHRKDINLARKEMTVKGKNGYRTIPISDEIFSRVEEYVSTISGYLFPHRTKPNEPMTRSGYRKEFIKRIKLMGLENQEYVPYSFRHSFAERNSEEQNFDYLNLAGHMGTSIELILNTYAKKNKKKMREGLNKDRLRKNGVDPIQKINDLFILAIEKGFINDPRLKVEKSAEEFRVYLA